MEEGNREAGDVLDLDVELAPGPDVLMRLLVVLHRRGAVVLDLRFTVGPASDTVRLRARVRPGRARHTIASLRREVFVIDVVEAMATTVGGSAEQR